jgi:transcriptional regulator with XRE-family HTH domain
MTNRDNLIQRAEAGEYIASLRNKRNLSLVILANELGISKSYLNEIEKGKKTPADELLRTIAGYFEEADETDLFLKFGKQPLLMTELFADVPNLKKTLAKVQGDEKLTNDEKFDFAEEIERMYMKYIKNKG